MPRFDFDKAKWFNQQYIIAASNEELAKTVRPIIESKGHKPSEDYLAAFCGLLKERVTFLPDFWESGYYFFEDVKAYDEKNIRKKWKLERRSKFDNLHLQLKNLASFDAASIESAVKNFMSENELGFGDVLPILRISLSGTMKGPSVFDMMALMGKELVVNRLAKAYEDFTKVVS